MSTSPSNILIKLDQLKKWQEEQQKRLTKDHNKRLQTTLTPVAIKERNDSRGTILPKTLSKEPIAQIQRNNEVVGNPVRPKRPFLRKGVGLVRFRMSPGDQWRPNVKPCSPKSEDRKRVPLEKKAAWQADDVNCNLTPLSTANLPSLTSKVYEEPSVVNLNASEAELLMFENLERRVEQNSFCSMNSSVLRFISSTPQKDSPVTVQSNEVKQACVVQKRPNAPSNGAYKQLELDGDESELVEIDAKEPIAQANHKAIGDNHSKFQQIEEYEQKLQNEYLSLIQKAMQFQDYVVNDNQNPSNESVTSNDVDDITEEHTLQQFDDETKWTDTDAVSNRSDSVISSIKSEPQISKVDVETMTEIEQSYNDDADAVEKDLKRLYAENAKTAKMKDQLEREKREFERHKREILKHVEDEKANNNILLQEERKRLAKEKMVFEQYVKDLQNKPNKKEREEISALKSEVATLQETMKLKEAKHGTTQARLRNQIKVLETKNSDLIKEAERLTKQNARLVATATQTNRKNPSDTKILHEINKNLTKLAQDQLEKLVKPTSNDEIPKVSKVREKENKTSSYVKESLSKSLEEFYEETFGQPILKTSLENFRQVLPRTSQEFDTENSPQIKKNDRNEITCDDGSKKIEYSNGNIKIISPDGNLITFKYYNGDVKETNLLKGTVKYFYHNSQVNHTTNADGSQLIEYPDGQVEKRQKDGECEVYYPNGIKRVLKSNSEEICYPDGTLVFINEKGERIIQLLNGQREVHTNEHKRREYPDGTIKVLYPNGLQETRYANGRIRIKDKNGQLLMDSENSEEIETIIKQQIIY